MNRPAPRKSSLQQTRLAEKPGSNPTHADVVEMEHEPVNPDPDEAAAEASQGHQERAPKHPNKVSVYLEPAEAERIRLAIIHTNPHEGIRSVSGFIKEVALAAAEGLERRYNDGKPFPPVPGEARRGGPRST